MLNLEILEVVRVSIMIVLWVWMCKKEWCEVNYPRCTVAEFNMQG